jgi:hypothetical protein
MRVAAALVLALALVSTPAARQRQASPRPQADPTAARRDAKVPFVPGETLTYDVSWANLVTAGTAVIRVGQKRPSFNSTAYEITADGRPLPLLARLYPVYYKMDSLLDTTTLLAQWTGLYTEENSRKRQTHMRFNRTAGRIEYEMTTEPVSRADLPAPSGVQDGLAALYMLRARELRAGQRFTVPVADDGSLYAVEFSVAGSEQAVVPLGSMDAWKVATSVLDEDRQPVGQNIAIWISTDPRRLPLKIQADLSVGTFVLALRAVQPA